MSETSEYIESYFRQGLNNEERKAFELRIETDEEFAKEVAFYITARQALHETLLDKKTEEWKDENQPEKEATPVISIAKKAGIKRWITYAAAACLLLAVSVYLFEFNDSPQKLASNYIKDNYTILGHTMGSQDSIQQGIEFYNGKNFSKALVYFKDVEERDNSNTDVKQYLGLSYIQEGNYEKALQTFDELAAIQGLQSNPGDFLKGLTLMKRNNPGDKEKAKALFEKVVNENEDGSKDAAKLLKKL